MSNYLRGRAIPGGAVSFRLPRGSDTLLGIANKNGGGFSEQIENQQA